MHQAEHAALFQVASGQVCGRISSSSPSAGLVSVSAARRLLSASSSSSTSSQLFQLNGSLDAVLHALTLDARARSSCARACRIAASEVNLGSCSRISGSPGFTHRRRGAAADHSPASAARMMALSGIRTSASVLDGSGTNSRRAARPELNAEASEHQRTACLPCSSPAANRNPRRRRATTAGEIITQMASSVPIMKNFSAT